MGSLTIEGSTYGPGWDLMRDPRQRGSIALGHLCRLVAEGDLSDVSLMPLFQEIVAGSNEGRKMHIIGPLTIGLMLLDMMERAVFPANAKRELGAAVGSGRIANTTEDIASYIQNNIL